MGQRSPVRDGQTARGGQQSFYQGATAQVILVTKRKHVLSPKALHLKTETIRTCGARSFLAIFERADHDLAGTIGDGQQLTVGRDRNRVERWREWALLFLVSNCEADLVNLRAIAESPDLDRSVAAARDEVLAVRVESQIGGPS